MPRGEGASTLGSAAMSFLVGARMQHRRRFIRSIGQRRLGIVLTSLGSLRQRCCRCIHAAISPAFLSLSGERIRAPLPQAAGWAIRVTRNVHRRTGAFLCLRLPTIRSAASSQTHPGSYILGGVTGAAKAPRARMVVRTLRWQEHRAMPSPLLR